MIRAKVIKRGISKTITQPVKARRILHDNLEVFLANHVLGRFLKTTKTWHHQPVFTMTVQSRLDAIVGKVASEDPIYAFVSYGTRVRYATMTPDFVAKTKRGIIGSGFGAGGVAFVSRAHPRPGIEARGFVEQIGDEMEPELYAMLDRIFAMEIWL